MIAGAGYDNQSDNAFDRKSLGDGAGLARTDSHSKDSRVYHSDVRPDHEDPGQPTMDELAAACEVQGLRFVRYPLTMMNFPGDDVAGMAEEFEPETGKVLAYCRTGTRSANLWILTLAGDARLVAFATAERYGINTMSARQLG
ncbi:MAG: sulfur transferase domain-containing protein [Luminiphilus sp.]|nr:sulfur transferase domain-containing protein [Luminiphilus sp.]